MTNPDSTEAHLAVLDSLMDLTERFASVHEPDALIELIEQEVAKVVAADYSAFYFQDREAGTVRLLRVKGLSPEELLGIERTERDSLPGLVIRNGQPLDVPNTDATDALRKRFGGHGYRSLLYYPVVRDDICFGCIGLGSAEPDAFTDENRHLLSLVSKVAAITFGNIAYVTQIREAAGRRAAEYRSSADGQRYRNLDWQQDHGVAILDADDRILFCNPAGGRILGVPRDALVGRRLAEFEAVDRRSRRKTQPRAQAPDPEGSYELDITRPDGTRREICVSVVPWLSEEAAAGEAVMVFTDQTEQRRTVSELQQLRLAVETMQLGLTIADDKRKIIYTNPAEAQMHGFTVEELIGKSVSILAPPAIRRPIPIEHLLDSTRLDRESVNLCKDGTTFPVRLITDLVRDEHGRPTATVTLSEDLTQKRRSERSLQQIEEEKERLRAQLFQAQKMEAVGQLAGGIAHDFNNLLTVINGYGSILAEQVQDDAELRADVQEIIDAGEKATSLTRQLLAFGRRQVIMPKVLDLNGLIANLERMMRRLLGEDIQVSAQLAKGLHSVYVDPGQIEQVILNLAVNARDAMPEGGALTITTENITLDWEACAVIPEASSGRHVRIIVEDSGAGMTQHVQSRIFEPFFSTKGQGKGTGLGLSVVYGIVKQHNGWINVYSEPGQGTAFKIYLPEARRHSSDEHATVAPRDELRGHEEQVLVVEDDAGVRELATRMLRSSGYRVISAETSTEALEIIEAHPDKIHILFTDVVLPGESGIELADQLVMKLPDLVVVLTSGYTDEKSRALIAEERGYTFLQKPYSIGALLRSLKAALEGETKSVG
ncbi:MAG: PAS domain S-box protein [bacterium]